MAERTVNWTRTRAVAVFGSRPSGTRHPLVAVAMVLPFAVLLAIDRKSVV